jgi:hypothetical protein
MANEDPQFPEVSTISWRQSSASSPFHKIRESDPVRTAETYKVLDLQVFSQFLFNPLLYRQLASRIA